MKRYTTPDAIKTILRRTDIETADVIATLAIAHVNSIIAGGRAAAALVDAGEMDDAMIELEDLLGRESSHGEEVRLERCIRWYLRHQESIPGT